MQHGTSGLGGNKNSIGVQYSNCDVLITLFQQGLVKSRYWLVRARADVFVHILAKSEK